MFKISPVPIHVFLQTRRSALRLVCAMILCGCSGEATVGQPAEPASSAVHMVAVQPVLEKAMRQQEAWFRTDEARRLADVLISWQNPSGGWWKKYDPTRARPDELPDPDAEDGPPGDTESVWRPVSAFDNGATYTELRLLARTYGQTLDGRYREAFVRGLRFIFDAQHPSGGWPQRYPLQDNYGRNVTFNDNAMVNVMTLLRDVAEAKPPFRFVSESDRDRAREAVARGIEFVLSSQIKVGGRLTGWCQQHDPVTLAPAVGRAYELPCVASAESAGIVMFLMEIPEPDGRVVEAIESAVEWFRASKITGVRLITQTGPEYERGRDRVLVQDATAPPMWARMYDIETGRPMFSSRDGVKQFDISKVSHERRNNYGWYGNWGTRVEEAYAAWKRRIDPSRG